MQKLEDAPTHLPSWVTAKRAWPIAVIFVAALVLRLLILASSQRYVDADEAVVGIMAKHIAELGVHPIFFYGQSYGGGAAVEAHLAALPFLLFGVSSLALKSVALAVSMGTLLASAAFCWRFFGRNHAIVSSAILATATALIELNTKMRGGYVTMLLLSVSIWYVFAMIAYEGRRDGWLFFALGALSGFAYYNQELIASQVLLLAVASTWWRSAFWNRAAISRLALGGIVGLLPLLYHNLTHGFSNWAHLAFALLGDGSLSLDHLLKLPTRYLPGLFVGHNIDDFAAAIPAMAWLEYGLYAGSVGYVLFSSRGFLRPKLRSVFSRGQPPIPDSRPGLETLLALSVLVHVVIYGLSSKAGVSPRYLLPIYPALAMVAGSAICELGSCSGVLPRLLALGSLVALVAIGGAGSLAHIRPATVTDGVYVARGVQENRETRGESIPAVIRHLRGIGVSHVRSPYFSQWRLVFESDESIIAGCRDLIPCSVRHLEYEERVFEADRVAYVFHRDSLLPPELRAGGGSRYYEEIIHEYRVFVDRRHLGAPILRRR